ncbi:MAG TPA: hypothetical protein VFY05_13830 [Candidatus Angelobacter sp.]|nr:hypothetical protein [Candidatus Angelobacter sp.]
MKIKAGITAALLSAFLMLGSTVPAHARMNCEKRIQKAENNLRKAVAKHGEHSRQAESRRHQLEETREKCGRDHDHDHDHR